MFVDVEADRMEAGMEGVLEVEQADRSTLRIAKECYGCVEQEIFVMVRRKTGQKR